MTVSFRDYSDVLMPLQPLNSGLPARDSSPPSSTESPDFLAVLGPLLDETPAEAIQPASEPDHSPPSWLFDLGAQRPEIQPPDAFNPPSTESLQFSPGHFTRTSPDNESLLQACKEIEGYLLGILLKDLGTSTSGSSLFSRTSETSYYQDMFFHELAQSIGNQGPGLGIAEVLMNDIIMKAGETV